MHLETRVSGKQKKYYLAYSFRTGTKVRKIRVYLGANLSKEELEKAAVLTAGRLNKAKGPTHVFIPRRGFSYPDQEGRAHWDPEGNEAFIRTLRSRLSASVKYDELDLHINDAAFIDAVVDELVRLMN